VAAEHDLAGWVEFRWWPHRRMATYACAIVAPQRRLIVAVDDELSMSTPTRSLEFRHTGMWAQHVCETPWEHWTVGLEAFGTEVDDAAQALSAPAWGTPTPLGLDLEWEALGPPSGPEHDLEQHCEVHGEVLVGSEAFDISAVGWRGRASVAPVGRVRGAVSAPLSTSVGVGPHEVWAPVAGSRPQPWLQRKILTTLDGNPAWAEVSEDW
jgi:hypothetical protein